MIIYSFKYTKADGTTSKRVLATLTTPNKFFSGVDITSLPTEEQVQYIAELDAARTLYNETVAQINKRYDLVHNYRQFNPDQMSCVKHEEI